MTIHKSEHMRLNQSRHITSSHGESSSDRVIDPNLEYPGNDDETTAAIMLPMLIS